MRRSIFIAVAVCAVTTLSLPAWAMHIPDGVLPLSWAAAWGAVAAAAVAVGLYRLRRTGHGDPRWKFTVALWGSVVFVISCMPLPVPVVGSCSHPCGTGMAAALLGPWATCVLASCALFLQALLLAHGGISTLGANIVSMGLAGSLAGWAAFKMCRAARLPLGWAAFAAGFWGDVATYVTTASELALGLGSDAGGTARVFTAALAGFAPAQIPIAVLEGILAAVMIPALMRRTMPHAARQGGVR